MGYSYLQKMITRLGHTQRHRRAAQPRLGDARAYQKPDDAGALQLLQATQVASRLDSGNGGVNY